MSIFKRISATISSSIDQAVGEIENHDAVIQVSMEDVRKQVAEARVRLKRVRREAAELEGQVRESAEDVERWKHRARQSAENGDEERALICLRRSHACTAEAERRQQALHTYRETVQALERDIRDSESRLTDLSQRHSLMKARESAGKARQATAPACNPDLRELEDTFDRWEVRLAAVSPAEAEPDAADALEREFLDAEEKQALAAELAELMNEEASK